MSTVVLLLRAVSLLVFVGAMLRVGAKRRVVRHDARPDAGPKVRTRHAGGARAPLVANLAALGLFLLSLMLFAGTSEGSAALPLALAGCLVAMAGIALVVRSRAELGAAWSLVPRADKTTGGLVTTGPYRRVRHPIYLGLAVLALGEALAFASWPSVLLVLFGIVPTLAWRARTEDKLLRSNFGQPYEVYRQRTRMIVPRVL